jgi:hypothetical protein
MVEGERHREPGIAADVVIAETLHELSLRINAPKGGDFVHASWAQAERDMLLRGGLYSDLVIEQRARRPTLPLELTTELRWKAAHRLEMVKGRGFPENGYPRNRLTPQSWISTLERLSDPSVDPEAHSKFRKVIMDGFNCATKPERVVGAIFGLAGLRKQGEIGAEVRVFDGGCSLNLCMTSYALSSLPGFLGHHTVNVVNARSHNVDPTGTHTFANYLRDAPQLKYSLGVDLVDIEDEEDRELARASSFYGHQLLKNPASYEAYLVYEASKPSNVDFMLADLLDMDIAAILDRNGGQKFDGATLFTVIYQRDHSDIKKILENVFKISDRIFIQDTVTPHRGSQSGLRRNLRGYQQEFKYRLLLAELVDSVPVFRELFVWENGRCEKGYFGRDIGRIGLKHVLAA